MTQTAQDGFVDPRGTRAAGLLTGAIATATVVAGASPVALGLSGTLAAVLLAAAAGGPAWNAWGYAYRAGVRPFLAAPKYLEPEAPTRFAQLLGGVVTTAGAAAYWTGYSLAAQGLVAIVGLLAFLNGVVGFCLGCHLYGWIVAPAVRRAHAKRQAVAVVPAAGFSDAAGK